MQEKIVGFRLSPQQERLWHLQQTDHRSPYIAKCSLLIEGNLNKDILQSAIQDVIDRHEILRTTFRGLSEMTVPVQVIGDGSALAIREDDLSDSSAAEQKARLEMLFQQAGSDISSFDEGLLLQVSVVTLSPSRHVMVISLPALCADAATLKILVKEISRSYQSLADSQKLEGEPVQYADLSEWENELLESEETRAGRDYWRERYSQALLSAKLPFESQSLHSTAFDPRSIVRTIDQDLTSRVESLASDHNTSLSTLLLSCWCTLLWRLTGQPELTIGTAFDGRKYEELEDALGPFVKYLPITCRFEKHQRFSHILNQINDATREAHGWEEFFFWKQFTGSNGNAADASFLHFGFDFDEWPASLSAGEISFSTLALYTCADRFKLKLSCVHSGDSLVTEFHYAAAMLSAEDTNRLAGEFQRLLESVVSKPDAEVGEIDILSDDERRQVLLDFNRTRVDYPEGKYLHTMFEDQVKRSPNNVAVVFDGACLTYRELNARANKLARHLRRLGVGPDTLVAIFMERSIEMVTALLGVLKAGGAYLPLDPAYPKDRIAFMLKDSNAPLLLTQQKLADTLTHNPTQVICVDYEWAAIEQERDEELENVAEADNAAYVLYTSGSTGRPKGVMIPHRAISNHMMWMQEAYPLSSQDSVLQKTPMSFDASVWEFYAPLLAGGRVVEARPGGHVDSGYLVEEIEKERVTILQVVPSLLGLILSEEGVEECRTLRRVFCGGEALTASVRDKFHRRMRGELINLYGPTEAAIDTITWKVEEGGEERIVAIGRPISNTEIYILDDDLQPMPIGVIGEIHISGECLGRGYLNRCDLTAENFIPNPFSDRPGARMYKTGDLARHMRDGVIDYIDRKDYLVKFRGYRIELGEIESVLHQHEDVKQAVVIVREDVADDKRLVAYIVPGQRTPSTNQLRNHVKELLPEYMLPSAYVMVDSLPLTQSGKIDRRSLPAPGPARPEMEEAYVAPRTEIEKSLAAVWSKVLGLEEVGIHDNFFNLGGDSIRSIQVVALAKESGMIFALESLFQHQTIAELVNDIEINELAATQFMKTEPFSLVSEEDRLKLPEDVEDAYPLTMLQAGMIYHLELTPDSPTYHNVNSYKLKCRFEPEAFQQAVQFAVSRHANLRTSFDLTTYTQPLQLVHKTAFLPVSVEDIRDLSPEDQEQTVETFLQSEYNRLFDLSSPPLLRFHIHRLSDDSIQFTLTECHAIADGWSLTSTLSEIFGNYFALVKGESPLIEEAVSSSFRDYVLLERKALQSEECRNYWLGKLNNAVFTGLPTWGHEETDTTRKTRKHNSLITSEMYHQLKRFARSVGVPLKSVLLAAHVKVMSILSGRANILTGLVTNGRPEEVGAEQVRGLFLNTVPFSIDLASHSWADLVREVFAAEVELSPYRRYPMATLQKDLKGQPLFEVMFNYLNFHSVEDLLASGNVEVLESTDLSVTNLALHVTFFQAPIASPYISLMTEYSVPEWTEEYIDAIHGYYHRILQAMVSDPLSRHDSQTLLSSKELHQLLKEWNNTESNYSSDRCIHHLFEEQVKRSPEEIALMFADESLSYRELNGRANQLAHHLIELGAGPETAVAICLNRSAEMVIALLAVLKSGAAYVPLDPAYPPQRTEFILQSSHSMLILTQQALVERLPASASIRLCIDRQPELIGSHSQDNPVTAVSAGNLAYIIYTSGSTGQPKGVAIQHSSAGVFLQWAASAFDEQEMRGVLASTSICFDLSVFEIFGALCSGGKVIVVENVLELEQSRAKEEVRLINTVPSAMAEVVRGGRMPRSVRVVNLAGEALSRRLVEQIYEVEQVERVMNLYGPSEDTTYTTYGEMRRGEQRGVTIGRPVAETQVYILDEQQQLVAAGVSGEMYISGAGLARGYYGRADQTAERFVPNPYSEQAGARMYRTGDVCRYRADGEIEYVGRADTQVKVRGYRIELGEIEEVLGSHPKVKQQVVMMRGGRGEAGEEGGDKKIIAYIVEEAGEELSVEEMRRYMKERVPEYMVPGGIVKLEQMPLTPNGKVDRKALPLPDHFRPELEIGYVAPQTEMERTIANVCQQILNIEKVGIHDNFFDLGAHSILLLQIHSKLEEAFNTNLPMTDMFEYPSINALAKYLTQVQSGEPSSQQGKGRAEARKKSAMAQNQARRKKGALRKGKGSGGLR